MQEGNISNKPKFTPPSFTPKFTPPSIGEKPVLSESGKPKENDPVVGEIIQEQSNIRGRLRVESMPCRYCGKLYPTSKLTYLVRHEYSCEYNPNSKNCFLCKHSDYDENNYLYCKEKGGLCNSVRAYKCSYFKHLIVLTKLKRSILRDRNKAKLEEQTYKME